MSIFQKTLLLAVLPAFCIVGCQFEEEVTFPTDMNNPTGRFLEIYVEPHSFEFADDSKFSLAVGMTIESAINVLSAIGIAPIDDHSPFAIEGGHSPRNLLVGTNEDGHALCIVVDAKADDLEVVSNIYWHQNFVSESESDMPLSARGRDQLHVNEVDLRTARLTGRFATRHKD